MRFSAARYVHPSPDALVLRPTDGQRLHQPVLVYSPRRGAAGVVKLWGIDPAQKLLARLRHPDVVKAIFSPGEDFIVSWSGQFIRVWDAENGYAITPALSHKNGTIKQVKFNADTHQVFVRMDNDNGVRVWNLPASDAQG